MRVSKANGKERKKRIITKQCYYYKTATEKLLQSNIINA
jgi:hypothetical protein